MGMLILEYARIVLSWPVVIGVIAAFFLISFQQEIRGILHRVASVKLPGFELTTPQVARPEAVVAPNEPSAAPPNLQGLTLNEGDAARLKSWFDSERLATKLWEFQFLNYFFAMSTQYVLNWLLQYPQDVTRSAYDARWTAYIFSAEERNAVIAALAAHGLIESNGNIMRVTEKGREYAQWPGRTCMGYVTPTTGVVPFSPQLNFPA